MWPAPIVESDVINASWKREVQGMQSALMNRSLDRLLVGLWHAVACTMAFYGLMAAAGSLAHSPVDFSQGADLSGAFLYTGLIAVFPLLIGSFIGAPSLNRQTHPGPLEYVTRAVLVAVLSVIVNIVLYSFVGGFGLYLIGFLLVALPVGAIAGILLYLVRGRRLRQNRPASPPA
jgi:hypothetical protein